MCDVSIKYDRESIILLQYYLIILDYDNYTELRVSILFITILYKVYYADTSSIKWALTIIKNFELGKFKN